MAKPSFAARSLSQTLAAWTNGRWIPPFSAIATTRKLGVESRWAAAHPPIPTKSRTSRATTLRQDEKKVIFWRWFFRVSVLLVIDAFGLVLLAGNISRFRRYNYCVLPPSHSNARAKK